MTLFENLLALLLAAILLLQVARRLNLPYPAMLAGAGVAVAFVPGAPTLAIDPRTALPLFIAPVLLDAAFDFPIGAAWRLWRPLVMLAVVAVVLTAAAVAWLGWMIAGLPLAAAVVLGAIVAPPDAAAATAVMRTVAVPRATAAVIKGESLFNDATALLLFGAALAVQTHGAIDPGLGLRIALAAPGGVLLGIALAYLLGWATAAVGGTLGGNLLQFVNAFLVWIVADRLGLSAVLAEVALAMTIARRNGSGSPRMRVQSYAVWAAVVFLLNVLAFLLMGMQARLIVERMGAARLREAAGFVLAVVAAVIVVRFAAVIGFNRLTARFGAVRGDLPRPKLAQGLVVAWSGMRGLVTLATAFALPQGFPQRDLVALTAFGVVLATLVVQGLTLTPLIRLLGVDRMEDRDAELVDARGALAAAGLAALDGETGTEADNLRFGYALADGALARHCALGLRAVAATRARLEALRAEHRIGAETFELLQEEIDWRELALLPDEERRIEES